MEYQQLPVEYFRCHITIRLPEFLDGCTLANKRKMFKLIFEDPYRNEETIRILDAYILEMSEELKAIWAEKGLRYQREYKDPVYFLQQHPGAKKDAVSIRAKNKRTLEAVKAAKNKYEDFQKVIAAWDSAKRN